MTIRNPRAVLSIDGIEVSPRLARVPTMGLSSARAGMSQHRFELKVRAEILCEIASPAWEQYVQKCKRSDQAMGKVDPDDWVAAQGYPSLDQVIQDPTELGLLFGNGGSLVHQVFPLMCDFENELDLDIDAKDLFYLDEREVENLDGDIRWTGICYRPHK